MSGTQDKTVSELLNQPFLTETEVSLITKRSLSALRADRCAKRGFTYFLIGKHSIRYRTEDILAGMQSRPVKISEVTHE